MADYEKMYHVLFAATEDALTLLEENMGTCGELGVPMVELTRFNDTRFLINTELIEMVEETPDTVVTLTTGKKLIVKESKEDIKNKVIAYKKEIFSNLLKV